MKAESTIESILKEADEELERGAIDAARKLLERAEAINPHDRDALLFRAALHAEENAIEATFATLELALEHHGDDPVVLATAAGYTADLDGDPEGALPLLEEADAILEARIDDDSDPEGQAEATELRSHVLLLLAECRGDAGDAEGALEAAKAVLEVDAESVGARMVAAEAELDLGRPAAAKKWVGGAIDRDPEAAEAYWLFGWIERLSGHDQEAKAAFARAAEIEPDRFAPPIALEASAVSKMVTDAIATLPDRMRDYLAGVPVRVEEDPPRDDLRITVRAEGEPPDMLPEEERWSVRPKAIRFFRKNLEVLATDVEGAKELVRWSLIEEVATFLGLESPDLGDGEGEDEPEPVAH